MSNRFSGVAGAPIHTCPTSFVTVHVPRHTYASSIPSSLCVTMIRSSPAVGEWAIRIARIGLPAVDSSISPPHDEPSHSRVFGLLVPSAPEVDRYAISAPTGSAPSRYWRRSPSSTETLAGNVPPTLGPPMVVAVIEGVTAPFRPTT